jgi:hypothetical protein
MASSSILTAYGSVEPAARQSTAHYRRVYLICCLGVLRLPSRHVAMAGAPFVAPGGALVPLGASAIIVWMLSTLSMSELGAAALLVAVSGIGYSLQAVWSARAADRAVLPPPIAGR